MTTITNHEIAKILLEVADKLEIDAHNPYRVKAYRRAARSIDQYPHVISDLVNQGFDLTNIANVGKNLSAHIKTIVETGEFPGFILQKTETKRFRDELKEITGLGPKRIQLLRTKFNIQNKNDLLKAIDNGELIKVPGFSTKLIEKITASLAKPKLYQRIFKYRLAALMVESLVKHLQSLPNVELAICASDYRRRVEVVGNVSILVTSNNPETLVQEFIKFDEVYELVTVNAMTATVILRSGMLVTLRIIDQNNMGAILINETGSPEHLAALQALAEQENLTLNSAGLFANNEEIHCDSEQKVYRRLHLQFIEPELRENRGEIQASKTNKLPTLINLSDIKGDLHSHTNETDGVEPLETMVNAAIRKGYQYLAITDHTKRLVITNGLDEKRLLQQIELIDELNNRLKNFTILKSSEVDILKDGTLDLPNSVLKELDLCVCSIHSHFNLPLQQQTERIIRAMDNPYFTILGHATGRLINYRQPYPIDIERVIAAAKERNRIIELNAQPSRLDIKDIYCQLAKLMGVKIAISSDAHSIYELEYMQFGVLQARRGWLEAADVINTYSLNALKKLLAKC